MKFLNKNIFLALPILIGLSALILSGTFSYFHDRAKTTGNTFIAGTWETSPKVVVNEVYYYVADDKKGVPPESKYEWIEFYNPSGTIVNLKDWEICDNHSCKQIHQNISINPNEFILVSHDSSIWAPGTGYWSIPPGTKTINLGGAIGNGLANTGDRVILKDKQGNIIDAMNYGNDTAIWNPACPGVAKGSSLTRSPNGHDTNSSSDFIENTSPTPGT